MNFDKELSTRVTEIENIIQNYLPEEEGYPKTVLQAMNYSVLAGGKRLRPMLLMETFRLFGGEGKLPEPFMAAIEMLHTYSLVHDDLPAMDNDEFRRGRKTTHVVYGEAMAILAGDGLLNYAFETALSAFHMAAQAEEEAKPALYAAIAEAMQIFAGKAGIYGMIGGQTADIEAEDSPECVTKELLLYIHEHKTAALIQSAMMIGAVLAGASKEDTGKIEKIAYNVGIAFQIQDDILDVTSSMEVLGKPVGSDEKNNKKTYVTLAGIEQSKQDVAEISQEAVNLLQSFGSRNEFLELLVKQLITREK